MGVKQKFLLGVGCSPRSVERRKSWSHSRWR